MYVAIIYFLYLHDKRKINIIGEKKAEPKQMKKKVLVYKF